MSVTGKVKNGVVVLPANVTLPEGAAVRVETLDVAPEDDPLVSAVRRLARPRPHLPKDYALNHGHSVRGEPRK
ncbi:MAG TPA: hypothetical protein VN829_20300 [Dongiaceae bacterium]|nr:hypothetical protein [Dongiaceae bacterium]